MSCIIKKNPVENSSRKKCHTNTEASSSSTLDHTLDAQETQEAWQHLNEVLAEERSMLMLAERINQLISHFDLSHRPASKRISKRKEKAPA